MPLELLDHCERQAATFDLKFVTLTIPYRRHRRRVRLFPGVLGQVIGSSDGKLIVSVAIADIIRYFVRHLSSIEGHALRHAEAGDHDEAARWLAQYVAVRDRLGASGMWRSRV